MSPWLHHSTSFPICLLVLLFEQLQPMHPKWTTVLIGASSALMWTPLCRSHVLTASSAPPRPPTSATSRGIPSDVPCTSSLSVRPSLPHRAEPRYGLRRSRIKRWPLLSTRLGRDLSPCPWGDLPDGFLSFFPKLSASAFPAATLVRTSRARCGPLSRDALALRSGVVLSGGLPRSPFKGWMTPPLPFLWFSCPP